MRQKLGQHFLINPQMPAAIAAALDVRPEEAIIEIGPGHGELTQAILAARDQSSTGEPAPGDESEFVAIEKDPVLAEETGRRFDVEPGFRMVEGDVLEDLPRVVAGLRAPTYKLTGNIPYYLTGHLLRLIGELPRRPARTILMIQKEVAERVAALPPHMNRLAASVQFWAVPRLLFGVPRRDFNPPPEVDSAVLELQPRQTDSDVDPSAFYATVRMVFAQPRKTILNNVKEGLPTRRGAENAAELIERAGIDPHARPQDLPLAAIEKLAATIRESAAGWG